MTRSDRTLIVLFLRFILAVTVISGSSLPAQEVKPADYSKEAFVVERKTVKIAFENDGTYAVDTQVRIRVQSQAGVQTLGVLNFPYASATSTMDVAYVRVIKPNKQMVNTPEENILDMPAEITQQAPIYSDLKTKQIAVKGLEVGDTLEFNWHEKDFKALDPGQFWYADDFFKGGVVLEENLAISVPRGRYVKVASPRVPFKESDEGAVHVYTWKTAHLTGAEASAADADAAEGSDVRITSFRTWDELGEWIRNLFAPRAVPTPEIQAKATELTKNAKTESEKIQAIYEFVSSQYHYIGIDFGIGRLQPHSAAEVLTNRYGDCKDKHTLFAALLAAAGIKAYPALMNATAKIDPDIPSPGQFDHVVTAIPQGQGFLFLDTTPEVAPYGYLMDGLRDKKALVVPDSGPSAMVETPPDPPFPSYFYFQVDGKLDDGGTLDAKMQMTFRGDSEIAYRLLMRQAAQPQWNAVVQQISSRLGFGGTVSDVTASAPEATDTPFHIEYQYKRETYSDWGEKRFSPPFPPVFLSPLPDKLDSHPKPLELGSPSEIKYTATLVLPSGADPQVPPPVNLTESFAEYHTTYSYSGGYFRVERDLKTKARSIDSAEFAAYRAFTNAVDSDIRALIPIFRSSWASTDTGGTPEAQALYDKGRDAWSNHDVSGAADMFQQAVQKDPKFADALVALGGAHYELHHVDQAVEDWKKAATLNPTSVTEGTLILVTLGRSGHTDDAIAIWQIVEKGEPNNPDVHEELGNLLSWAKRYPEAIAEYEKTMPFKPNDASVLEALGAAELKNGEQEKGVADLEKSVALDGSGFRHMLVAREFADHNIRLDEALQYAQFAVSEMESTTAKLSLDTLKIYDFRGIMDLANDWELLGWVQFRLGHYDQAAVYENAAAILDPTDGERFAQLGQIYEKQGKKLEAMIAYTRSLATRQAPEGTKERLETLRVDGSVPPARVAQAPSLQDLRTFKLDPFPEKPKGHANAEFNLIFESGPKLTSVKFVSGADELRDAGAFLQSAKIDIVFPDDHPTKILRRAVLDCEPEIPGCILVFVPPFSVTSAQ